MKEEPKPDLFRETPFQYVGSMFLNQNHVVPP